MYRSFQRYVRLREELALADDPGFPNPFGNMDHDAALDKIVKLAMDRHGEDVKRFVDDLSRKDDEIKKLASNLDSNKFKSGGFDKEPEIVTPNAADGGGGGEDIPPS